MSVIAVNLSSYARIVIASWLQRAVEVLQVKVSRPQVFYTNDILKRK